MQCGTTERWIGGLFFLGFKCMLEGMLFSKSKNIPDAGHSFSFPQSRPLLFLIRPSPTPEHRKPELEVKGEDGVVIYTLIHVFKLNT